MSYSRRRGLGQAKVVPGQISFATLPQGRTSLPSLQPLVEAGLPIAPYIEHGSYETGEPAIMRYGLDPYRGIMGLGSDGLGSGGPLGLFVFLQWLFGGFGRRAAAESGSAADRARAAADAAVSVPGRTAEQQRMVEQARAAMDQHLRQATPTTQARVETAMARATIQCAGDPPITTVNATALTEAAQLARSRGRSCTVQLSNGRSVVVDSSGRPALGDILTDYACSSSELNRTWTERTRATTAAAAQAAVVGGIVAGVIGAVTKNPVLAAGLGAGVGYGALKLWTSPYEV